MFEMELAQWGAPNHYQYPSLSVYIYLGNPSPVARLNHRLLCTLENRRYQASFVWLPLYAAGMRLKSGASSK